MKYGCIASVPCVHRTPQQKAQFRLSPELESDRPAASTGSILPMYATHAPCKARTAKQSANPTKSTCIFKPDHTTAILAVFKTQHSKPCGEIPDNSYKQCHRIRKRTTLRFRFTSDGSDPQLNHSRCLNWKRTTTSPAVGCKAPGAYTLSQDSEAIFAHRPPITPDARGQHRHMRTLIDSAIDLLHLPKSSISRTSNHARRESTPSILNERSIRYDS